MRRRLTIGSMAAALTLGIASNALADPGDHYLSTYGGGWGGNQFSDYATQGFLSGIHIYYGNLVDAVRLIDQGGNEGPRRGGSGGNKDDRSSCPSGWAMYGIYGNIGTMIDKLGAICINRANESTSYEPAYGGTGGPNYIESRCLWAPGTHESAVGLQGRGAAGLDRIGLVCNVNPR